LPPAAADADGSAANRNQLIFSCRGLLLISQETVKSGTTVYPEAQALLLRRKKLEPFSAPNKQ